MRRLVFIRYQNRQRIQGGKRGSMTIQEQYEIICKKAKKYDKLIGVLDKIKTEIESMDFDFGDYYDHTEEIVEMVCEVIDKYRESEE